MKLSANGLTLEAEDRGDASGTPLLLIPGLGSQLTYWPPEWIKGFIRAGYRVITFDNRDCGLSQRLEDAGVPDVMALKAAAETADGDVPYTLDDMAEDAACILEALAIPAAHVIGRSMGGLILQSLVHRHPERVLSATIMVSTSGAPSLSPMTAEAEMSLFADSYLPGEREVVISAALEADQVWASPKYPFDPAARRRFHERAYDRGHYPQGVARQTAALLHGLGRHERLAGFNLPALIIQGGADTIFPSEHGKDLSQRIRGAELFVVEGMGHDLEGSAKDLVFRRISDFLNAIGAEN